MTDTPYDRGECTDCGESFAYRIYHNGFGDSSYAYCEECGALGSVSHWAVGDDLVLERGPLGEDMIHLLPSCRCGGRFTADALPRCPSCVSPLDPDKAARWIEENAPGVANGWRWQRSWNGLYSIDVLGEGGSPRGV